MKICVTSLLHKDEAELCPMLSCSVSSHVSENQEYRLDRNCRIFRKMVNLNKKGNNFVKYTEEQTQPRVSTQSQAE